MPTRPKIKIPVWLIIEYTVSVVHLPRCPFYNKYFFEKEETRVMFESGAAH